MNWIFDHVPVWVWVVIATGGGGAIIAFVPGALALLVSIWNMMPRPVKIALGAVIGGIGLYLAGRNKGSKDEQDALAKREAGAVAQREKINEEVHQLPQSDLDRRLHRWDRPDP